MSCFFFSLSLVSDEAVRRCLPIVTFIKGVNFDFRSTGEPWNASENGRNRRRPAGAICHHGQRAWSSIGTWTRNVADASSTVVNSFWKAHELGSETWPLASSRLSPFPLPGPQSFPQGLDWFPFLKTFLFYLIGVFKANKLNKKD